MLDHDRRSLAPHPLPPVPLLPAARAAQARHARRALEGAVEHGIALLEALGLPRIVTPGFAPVDPAEIGDAVDQAIAALDEADAPDEDLEDEGEAEPSLGWITGAAGVAFLTSGGTADLELDTSDWEHSLGAPERHPFVATMTSPWFKPADGTRIRCYRRDESQASWAQGSRQDGEGEGEPGYDLPEGDDERCASGDVDEEPSLGSLDHVDQTAWADGTNGSGERELDPLDDVNILSTIEQREGRGQARRICAELGRRAEAIRRRRAGLAALPRIGGNLVPVDLRIFAVGRASLVGAEP